MEAAVTTGSLAGFTLSVGSTITITIWELFNSVKRLDNWDFCVYMQVVTHYRTHKEFTKEDLKEWFPNEENMVCNMHNDKWECDYLKDDDCCSMITDQHIEEALDSLYRKELLEKVKENGKYTFRFKR